MEVIRDNPLTLAAKEQAAREKAQRKVPRGFNATTMQRMAKVWSPYTVEYSFIREFARVQQHGNAIIERIMTLLTRQENVHCFEITDEIFKMKVALPGLLLHLNMLEAMVITADGGELKEECDPGGLDAFFCLFVAEADEVEFATRNMEWKRGLTPPPMDLTKPPYYDFETLELKARMWADEIRKKEEQDGKHV